MNLIWDVAIFAVLLNLAFCQLELKIKKGIIKGQILKSRDGRPYYSYTGVPYAKPPVGELRFKAPEPVEPWNGILDATKESNICIQQDDTNGHEDCLYLNVYTPKTNRKLLPVMFWIYGGAFSWGHSRSGVNGPDYFMDKDVVLVSIHYRLGILGFLSTEDDVIPGNYGMKDQVEALRWVKENIIYFNGDPSQVTIFGGSSGAASTGFHMLSPMSKGLFHKAILQSGAPTCMWAISAPGIARKRAYSIATIAGCYVDTSENVLNCLKKLPSQSLMDIHSKLFAWKKFPRVLFNPVVENCNADHESFLCHHPIYDFKQESFVPAIVGMNSDEGGMHVASLYNTSALRYLEFRTDFNRLMSLVTEYKYYTKPEYIDEIGTKLLEKYFPYGGINDDSHINTLKMFTDVGFGHCIFDMACKLSSPVYSYIYDYQNSFSYNNVYNWHGKPLGVTHGDELNSLFKMNILNPNGLSEKDHDVSKLMVNIWYKFVSSKIPTIDGAANGTVWPEFISIDSFLLKISSIQPIIIKSPLEEMYKFCSELPIGTSLMKLTSSKNSSIKIEL